MSNDIWSLLLGLGAGLACGFLNRLGGNYPRPRARADHNGGCPRSARAAVHETQAGDRIRDLQNRPLRGPRIPRVHGHRHLAWLHRAGWRDLFAAGADAGCGASPDPCQRHQERRFGSGDNSRNDRLRLQGKHRLDSRSSHGRGQYRGWHFWRTTGNVTAGPKMGLSAAGRGDLRRARAPGDPLRF
jgi:hypothetical protein